MLILDVLKKMYGGVKTSGKSHGDMTPDRLFRRRDIGHLKIPERKRKD